MSKRGFKDLSILEVLNSVTVHSQTEKYVNVISKAFDGKVKHARVFQIKFKR